MSENGAGNAMSLSHPLTSEDSDSDHTPAAPSMALHLHASADGSAGGSSMKKPRGRPPGSKNKPKPPLVITRESDSAMKPVVLEISAGSDVIEMITGFARRRSVGVTLLSGSGTVSNVTLRHPMSTAHGHGHGHSPASLVSLHGPFHLLSLWGSFNGTAATKSSKQASASSPAAAVPHHGFGITLSGAQGQLFGGVVGGKVVAAGPVVVVAATYLNPPLHRLPADREGGSGANEDGEENEQQAAAGKKHCEGGSYGGEIMCTTPISAMPSNY